MPKRCRLLVILAGLFLSAASFADWIEESDKNAMLVLNSQAKFQPESIARAGLSEFDGDVFDLNEGFSERQDANNRELVVELRKRLAAAQHPKVRQDLEILIQSLNDEIESRRINNKHLLPYFNIHRVMFGSFNALLDPRNG